MNKTKKKNERLQNHCELGLIFLLFLDPLQLHYIKHKKVHRLHANLELQQPVEQIILEYFLKKKFKSTFGCN